MERGGAAAPARACASCATRSTSTEYARTAHRRLSRAAHVLAPGRAPLPRDGHRARTTTSSTTTSASGPGLLSLRARLPVVATIHHPITMDRPHRARVRPEPRSSTGARALVQLPRRAAAGVAQARSRLDRVRGVAARPRIASTASRAGPPARRRATASTSTSSTRSPSSRGAKTSSSPRCPPTRRSRASRSLLEALAILRRKRRPSLELTVIGAPGMQPAHREPSSGSAVDDAVHFTGQRRGARRSRAATRSRRSRSCLRSTRASAFRPARRWRARCRSSPPPRARCPRWSARRRRGAARRARLGRGARARDRELLDAPEQRRARWARPGVARVLDAVHLEARGRAHRRSLSRGDHARRSGAAVLTRRLREARARAGQRGARRRLRRRAARPPDARLAGVAAIALDFGKQAMRRHRPRRCASWTTCAAQCGRLGARRRAVDRDARQRLRAAVRGRRLRLRDHLRGARAPATRTSARCAEVSRVLRAGGVLAVSVPRDRARGGVLGAVARATATRPGGHVRIYLRSSHCAACSRAAATTSSRATSRTRCTRPTGGSSAPGGVDRDRPGRSQLYHRLLVWDLMQRPLAHTALEGLLNPVIGKSVVFYAVKGTQMHEPGGASSVTERA